ncbi:MAG: Glu/Leu/Phe/Val dehydrogenase dimerization domain-containing protein [Thermoanaerobaculia bacterium]
MTWKVESRQRDEQHVVEAKEEGTSVAYIVIDSTVNGRSRGGLRIVPDLSEAELSVAARAMTLKYGLLGLPQGGAKAGILGNGEASPEDRQRLLSDFAAAVRPYLMQRTYQPDADLGTRGEDIRSMMCSHGLTVKHREWRGRDSGYYTAVSCVAAAEAAVEWRKGQLAESKVAIEGFGSVGSVVADLLSRRGASVVAISTSRGALYDPDGLDVDRLRSMVREMGSRIVEEYDQKLFLRRQDLLELPVNLLLPCARHHSLHDGNVSRISAKIICPGANNPATPEAEATLFDRGHLFLPDFVCNSGGVLGGTMEFAGISLEQTASLIEEWMARMIPDLLDQAERSGQSVRSIAEPAALERHRAVRAAAENPSLGSRLMSLALESHRRGWLPESLVGALSKPYFRRSLRL